MLYCEGNHSVLDELPEHPLVPFTASLQAKHCTYHERVKAFAACSSPLTLQPDITSALKTSPLLSSLHTTPWFALFSNAFPDSFPSVPYTKGTEARTNTQILLLLFFQPHSKTTVNQAVFTLSISFSSSIVCLLATSSWTVWPQFLTTDSMTCRGREQH